MTVDELRKHLERALDCENARFEAGQMIMQACGFDKTAFIMHKNDSAADRIIEQCEDYVRRRNAGEPLYYILGTAEFYSLLFYVGEGVLIPRQDTETLVDEVLCTAKNEYGKEQLSILDLCAGTGCIGIALAKHLSNCRITCVELYDKAFSYLERNIRLNNAENVTAIRADALKFSDEYDIVVSNPPYVCEYEQSSLPSDVLHEPHTALFAKDDGLEYYKAISRNFSKKCRHIFFEIGEQQGKSVGRILENNGFCNIRIIKDTNGLDRVVGAESKS